ncbi:MAG: hypothetical protein JST82_10235 [Bacteroidetes bacterium]|nr:hypothetical protein [Bacteroidota bacterium]
MNVINLLGVIVLSVFLLFIGRMIILWYWKVPEIIKLLETSASNSEKTNEILQMQMLQMKVLLRSKISKIQVQHKTTGEVKIVSIDEWLNQYALATEHYDLISVA